MTLFAGISAAGCESPPPMVLQPPAPAPVYRVDPDFAPGAALLSGFDRPRRHEGHGVEWTPGTQMLLGVKIQSAETRRVWYVLVESGEIDPDPDRRATRTLSWPLEDGGTLDMKLVSRVASAKVSVYDDTLTLLRRSRVRVPFEYLRHGPAVSARRMSALDENDGMRAIAETEGIIAFMTVVNVVRTVSALRPIVNGIWSTVVDPPDLLSIILRGGITIDLNAEFDRAIALESSDAWPTEGPVWLCLPIQANDKTVMTVELVAGEPDPPYLMSAGILRLVGRHPRASGRVLTIELLSARNPPSATEGEEEHGEVVLAGENGSGLLLDR